jgi:hypothetical protein
LSGVFLSYSRGDRALAAQVTAGLRRLGVEVRWDEDMPGVDWQLELERQINELAAVLVLWTPLSVSSMNVRDEARLGQQINKLVNGLAGVPAPPFPFDRINGLPLDGLKDGAPHAGWSRLVKTIEEHLVRAGSAKPGEITGALARHEHEVRTKQASLADAEAAYQQAKADEDAAVGGSEAAATALAAAEEMLARVVAMRGSPTVLRAAQADLEAAQSAKQEADRARRAAGAVLSSASRSLAGARVDLERFLQAGAVAPPTEREPDDDTGPARTAGVVPRAEPSARLGPVSPELRTGPRLRWAALGVAGVVVAGAASWFALSRPTNAPPGARSGIEPPAAAATSMVGAPKPLPDIGASGLTGEWSGNGATCANPLAIIVKGKVISLVLDGGAQKGAIQSVSDGGVSIAWPDGAWTYKVTGDTLTMTPSGGQPMIYQRCAG